MSAIKDSKLSAAEDEVFEAAREREFYRYWQPIARHYASPSKTPRASHDPALAAFTQFATLRLGARRSYISFFDRTSQYILSETSPSLSLDTNLAQDDRDKLWTGAAIFPRAGSICASTARPRRAYKEMEGTLRRGANIILDLKGDHRFCEIQKVFDHPHETFYVGVPIQTSRGYAIGSFCAFFDDPNRTDITDIELDFLKNLANTTMNHLEMVRAQADNLRSQDMIRGLGSFIVGGSSMNEWWLSSARNSRSASVADDVDLLRSPTATENVDLTRSRSSLSLAAGRGHASTLSDAVRVTSPQSTTAQEAEGETNPETNDDTSSIDNSRASFPEQSRRIFERASRIIAESADVDGVLFLDASVKSFGGLVSSAEDDNDNSSTTSIDDVATPFPHGHVQKQNYFEQHAKQTKNIDDTDLDPDSMSSVLAISMNAEAENLHQLEPRISEAFLRSLLKRYPHGHIWTFDEHEADNYAKTKPSNPLAKGEPTAVDTITTNMLKRQAEGTKDKRALQRLFPGVHSLLLVGLWDSQNSKWFAGSFVWSNNPVRIFSHENELGYIAAFADSIMADITRLQVRMSDTAKTDFISTISHELRSPLHGILGTSECLNDTTLDDYQHDLIRTLDHCGHTLLDTIDHLLDFAKINKFTKRASSRKKAIRGREDVRLAQSAGEVNDTGLLEEAVDLAKVTEEVIESTFAGYEHLHASGRIGTSDSVQSVKDVSLVLDIAKVQTDWVVKTQVGAWRRIVLNLVGNSLKFTEQGTVNVQLISQAVAERRGHLRIELVISDSGIGMSEEFLQNHLFTPFNQEDPHRPGTGLGLSLVHSIVISMGGTIEIHSTKGVGTKFTVSIEMSQVSQSPKATAPTSISQDVPIHIVGDTQSSTTNDNTEISRRSVLQTIEKQCRDWLKCPVKSVSLANNDASGIYICPAQRLNMLALQDSGTLPTKINTDKAVIVLCDSSASLRALRADQKLMASFSVIEYITQPYGPRKMSKTIALCADRLQAARKSTQSQTVSSEQQTGERLVTNPAPRSAPTAPIPIRQESASSIAQVLADALGVQKSQAKDVPLRPAWATPDPTSPTDSLTTSPPSSLAEQFQKPPTPPSSTSPPEPNAAVSKTTNPKSLHVLLVDDNPINLRLLTTYMKRAGHTFDTATNGLEAVEAYKRNALSVSAAAISYILMDISMPIMDGLEATRHIRAFEREMTRKPANIIALTGLSSEEARVEAFGSGVDLFLTKPVKMKELAGILVAD